MGHSFVAIELLDFQKLQNSFFCSQEFSVFGNKNSLRKKDDFLSSVIENGSRKFFLFVYKYKFTRTSTSKRLRAHFYFYNNQKNCETFYLYKNIDNLRKARQFTLRFYIYNRDTLRYAIFHDFFKNWHLYTKK